LDEHIGLPRELDRLQNPDTDFRESVTVEVLTYTRLDRNSKLLIGLVIDSRSASKDSNHSLPTFIELEQGPHGNVTIPVFVEVASRQTEDEPCDIV